MHRDWKFVFTKYRFSAIGEIMDKNKEVNKHDTLKRYNVDYFKELNADSNRIVCRR